MHRNRFLCCVFCGIAATLVTLLMLQPQFARAQNTGPVSFIKDVAPIFKENCFACHDAKKRSGKYDMTTFEKLMAGGTNGEQIIAGKPDESDLYDLIVTMEERRMPPRDKGEALSKEKADIVMRWIKEGAKLDGGIDPKADLVKELRTRWKPPVPPTTYKFPGIVNTLAFTPDNKNIVAGGHHELTVWSIAEGKLLKRIYTRAERAYAMAFLPDGKLIVAGGRPGQEGDVRIYDLNAPAQKEENGVAILDGVNDPKVMLKQLLDADDSVLCLSLSKDGKRLAAGGCDRIIRVWDLSGGFNAAKLEQSIENHADWVLGVTLAADGKHLLSSSRDKTAKVWDLAAKESVLTFPGHQNTVFDVAVSADGKTGYSVGSDNQLRAWGTSGEGKQIRANGGHGGEIYKLVAHPAQPMLVTCSADKTVKVWDANNGSNTKTLPGMTDFVYAVAISPDGTMVAGGAYDGEVRVWKLADASIIKAFNASPGYTAMKK